MASVDWRYIFHMDTLRKITEDLYEQFFNKCKSNLKFIYEYSKSEIVFRLQSYVWKRKYCYKSLYKTHTQAPISSLSSTSFLKSVTQNQAWRLNRLYSREKDFFDHTHKIKLRFEKWGYPQSMINREIRRVKFGESKQNRN